MPKIWRKLAMDIPVNAAKPGRRR
ncbi:MAG TPA: MFS transporter, partial [Shigella sp.]|nr:MFS transporter [Shigella sp.]